MKKRNVLGAAVLSLALAMGLTMGTAADGRKVVTLGADLTEEQRQMVMNYFGVTYDEVDILTITNQDEREHLGAYVPLEQIGSYTYSCALVSPTTSGGIQVKTANLDWVTCNMIATTLSTSGVVNCDVIAASPIQVSGTGALTGIMMAYEEASGEALDPVKKELATQELVITGQLANTVGQQEATAIVNEAKTEIISQNITDITIIQDIVYEAAADNNAELSEEELGLVTDLLDQISQEDYDYEEMEDTLQRVEENVKAEELAEITDSAAAAEDAEAAAQAAAEDAAENVVEEITEETEASILDNTNDAALGENVISGSTMETETEIYVEEVNGDEISIDEIPVETEAYIEEVPAETEAPAEAVPVETEAPAEAAPVETEAPAEEAPVETEAPAEAVPVETEAPATEAPEETEPVTEAAPVYTADMLDEAQKETYDGLIWYLKKVLGVAQEPSEKELYAKIDGLTVTALEMDQTAADTILEKVDTFILTMLMEGLESTELNEIDAAEYGDPEVKALYDEIYSLLIEDEEQLLVNMDSEIRMTACDEAKAFLKKLYGVDPWEEETEAPAEEAPAEEAPSEEAPAEEAPVEGEELAPVEGEEAAAEEVVAE